MHTMFFFHNKIFKEKLGDILVCFEAVFILKLSPLFKSFKQTHFRSIPFSSYFFLASDWLERLVLGGFTFEFDALESAITPNGNTKRPHVYILRHWTRNENFTSGEFYFAHSKQNSRTCAERTVTRL